MAISATFQACAFFKYKIVHWRYSMTPSSNEVTRRGFLAKIALLFNGFVGFALAIPIFRYLGSPVTRERKQTYNSWLPLGSLDTFPAGETRLATYRNPMVNAWTGRRRTSPAGCAMLMERSSRCLPSIVRIWDVRFAGSRNRIYSCVRAMAARITRMAPAPPALPSEACSNIPTKLRATNC